MSARPIRGICQRCGERARTHGGTYCDPHWQERERDLRAAQKAGSSAAGKRRWQEWKAAGIDPTHGGEAAAKRAQTIAASNRERPRRGQKE